MAELFYETVTPVLKEILGELMGAEEFSEFRLVGGTALSLRRGHRQSVDIDLFSDAEYGTVDFNAIDIFLNRNYPYVYSNDYKEPGIGTSYFIGKSAADSVKLDLFYTDKFIRPVEVADSIRMAAVEEIIAMKVEVISQGGRKKDFWDIHELMNDYTFSQMLALHKQRYPYQHDPESIGANFQNFTQADHDFIPVCLKGKHWEVIKLDMIAFTSG